MMNKKNIWHVAIQYVLRYRLLSKALGNMYPYYYAFNANDVEPILRDMGWSGICSWLNGKDRYNLYLSIQKDTGCITHSCITHFLSKLKVVSKDDVLVSIVDLELFYDISTGGFSFKCFGEEVYSGIYN